MSGPVRYRDEGAAHNEVLSQVAWELELGATERDVAARLLYECARAVERQAYDYFITITGAKYEECVLLTEDEPEAISIGDGWPTRALETPRGETEVADVLIR